MKLFNVLIIAVVLLFACNTNKKDSTLSGEDENMHLVKVKEVVQSNAYTYILANENTQDYWIAVGKIDVKVGEDYYYKDALEMNDFKSKELDRVFDRILFIQELSKTPLISKDAKLVSPNHSKEKTTEQMEEIQVDPIQGGITIAELYKNLSSYNGKVVMIRGKVVKFNKYIMSRHWVHLQDGTEESGKYDLTFTTLDEMNVGDIVTLEGTVGLNKEFGDNYSYDVIIEGSSLK